MDTQSKFQCTRDVEKVADACYVRGQLLCPDEATVCVNKYNRYIGKQVLSIYKQESQGGRVGRNNQMRLAILIVPAVEIE